MIRSPGVSQLSQPGCSSAEVSHARAEESRRSFLRRSALTGAAAGSAALLSTSQRAEAHFVGGFRNAAEHFRQIQGNENAHVAFLLQVLGSAAFPRPQYVNLDPQTVSEFADMSRNFENVGTKAYLGALPVFNQPQTLAQAGSIGAIEARQAGVLNDLLGSPVSQNGEHFETPLTPLQVADIAMQFFADPDLVLSLAAAIQPTRSDANDIAILRFALSLEYMETTFYNLNVPRFFGHPGHGGP
jgi:Ferritin-like domain